MSERVSRPALRPVDQRALASGAFAFMGSEAVRSDVFPIDQVDGDTLKGAVARWVSMGHAISFGLSSDAGAMGVHLIVSGQKRSKWFATVAELEDFLVTIPGPASPK